MAFLVRNFSRKIYPAQLFRVYHSGAFTDLTITCAGENFKVHTVVVCTQSPFFNTACSGPWKESQNTIVDLAEDDIEVVRRMIEFFYRADYTDFKDEKFTRHAQVFAIAIKYDIEMLSGQSTSIVKRP
ncbi:uncharacterized protein A1O5_07077 [Cladophialophora psammophila CBS 110553]|uniref:BTB domain-containing protein n=1 Tax=Cladophialophora psammophila CBS 110553 TaxID=1182543 RepID=W9XI16_9EURO|nr:uncharacterized protein A1O5_07077 [Cladophialophora psammophila CBS 110553]EXJ70004.1 hypothetical protein A1O5_07077 [Cladophialophora psammophila CBS 110553]